MMTREELYEMVWFKPMTSVAAQFEVSGSYMARVCSILRVPRPERGYWAKLAVGKAPARPPLPDAQPGDPLAWSRDGDLHTPPRQKPTVPPKRQIRQAAQPVRGTHGLIRGAKPYFEASRKVDEGQHLKPYKKLLVDVTTSITALDKALAFANNLFNALESAGHRVVLAPQDEHLYRAEIDEHEQPKKRQPHHYYHSHLWSPYRPTVAYVGTVAIGLAVIEMSESVVMRYIGNGKYIRDAAYVPPKSSRRHIDHTWTTTQDMPCGRLRLVAYSPYQRAPWSIAWQETKTADLNHKIPAVVKAIETGVRELVAKLEEAERQAELERVRWLAEEEKRRQEEDRRRIQQSIKDSREQLNQIIQVWTDVMNVERFLQGVQDRASLLPPDEYDTVFARLELAREFIGTKNPLDFFLSWKTPLQRYRPLSARANTSGDEYEDKDFAE